jgi:ATP-binding cassette subfamily B protein
MHPESNITARQVVKEFWLSVRSHKWYMWGAIFGIVITPIISVIIPLYYRQFFNVLNVATDKAAAQPELIHVILVILGLNGIYWVGLRINSICNNFFESRIMADMRQRAFAYLIGHSYAFFSNNFTGSLTQRVNRYARAFERLWDNVVMNVIPLAVSIIGITIAVWFVNPILSFVIIGWLILFGRRPIPRRQQCFPMSSPITMSSSFSTASAVK